MKYSKFFDEIFSSLTVATDASLEKYEPYLKALKNGTILSFPEQEKLLLGFFDGMMKTPFPNKTEEKGQGVAVIPINGLLSSAGSWWDIGTKEIANVLHELYANEAVKAIVFDISSQGGTTECVIPLESAIAKRNKPIISAVNSSCYSAAYYIASLTDKILSVHRMGNVGSIGIMTEWVNNEKALSDAGYKKIKIYAPESEWKNKPTREAEAGKPQLFKDEILSPWAIQFQNIVKANRKALDLNVEGILNGRTFYAYDALTNGLIDGIKPMDEILQYAFDYSTRKKFETL